MIHGVMDREVSLSVGEKIARCISRALYEELTLYPKPGLVSFVDSGSHPDMNADCFLRSLEALEPYFMRLAEAGARGADFTELQQIGILAEKVMLQTTNGRNTHRGAIFCLGLLASAAGWREANGSQDTLGEIVRERWGQDIPRVEDVRSNSHGVVVCRKYGVTGIRGEAIAGFPSVFEIGLPELQKSLPEHDAEAAALRTFFSILCHCEDTTLLRRGGAAALEYARREARRLLTETSDLRGEALRLHREFISRGWTAGGCADLLSATLFVHYWELER